MREILFRGKRIDNGEWVSGGVLQIPEYVAICSYNDYHQWHDFIEIIPETVGQFIGLTDKNGKKIFEGDIVKAIIHRCFGSAIEWREETGIVGYDNLGMLGLKDKEGVWSDFMCELCLSGVIESFCFEVIGNIHDNPELLKGGEG